MSAHHVSIVVPAYNAEETIGPLLDSIANLDYQECDVIIVNDGSTDRTKEIVERYPVQLINQPNRGASAARDAGLRAASGEIVAYVDSDVTVTSDWLKHLVRPFSDPTIAATTGQTVFLRSQKCASWLRSMDIERRNRRRKTYTRLANGPNAAFRREILLEVGGFDPRWYHAEDTEVSYRIWELGHRIQYVPEAVVHHIPEEDWRTYLRKRYRDAKAFTRMLGRYTRAATLEDDFVSLDMKVLPPVFLSMLFVSAIAIVLAPTPWLGIPLLLLGLLTGLALLFIVPEAIAIARASKRVLFFFQGVGLCILRGFAWGVGLGVGGLRQVLRA